MSDYYKVLRRKVGPDVRLISPGVTVAVRRPLGGEPRTSDASLEVRYFPADKLPPMDNRHVVRVQRALEDETETYFQPAR